MIKRIELNVDKERKKEEQFAFKIFQVHNTENDSY